MAQIPAGANRPHHLSRQQAGADYERRARCWLECKGLRFIAANVRVRGGELDLIMEDAGTLVFVEVRFRSGHAFGGATGSITYSKQRKLLQAARSWLSQRNGSFDTVDCRFDVVAFTGNEVEWLTNAFST